QAADVGRGGVRVVAHRGREGKVRVVRRRGHGEVGVGRTGGVAGDRFAQARRAERALLEDAGGVRGRLGGRRCLGPGGRLLVGGPGHGGGLGRRRRGPVRGGFGRGRFGGRAERRGARRLPGLGDGQCERLAAL